MSEDAYFLYHALGQYPGKDEDMATAMTAFAEVWAAPNDAQWGYALGERARFINLWTDLISAADGTVTTCESVTAGLSSLMGALPARDLKGKKVLVAADCFPSNHFLLTGLAERIGFDLVTVPLRQGATWVEDEDMIARWDDQVGLALLTWVSSTASRRCDLAALVAHGRAQGSTIGVDITQAAGLLPFDVMEPQVDFAISTSLKWMCGTPGAGILYVAPALIERAKPTLRGWFSQDNPFSWDLGAFQFAPDIRRFDSGTPSIVACAASVRAMEWHARQDKADLLAHNRTLCAQIIEGAQTLGLDFASPLDPEARGGSVMFRLPADIPGTDAVAFLKENGCMVDARGQTLRASPGVVTNAEGVAVLLDGLGRLMSLRQRRA